MKAIEYYNTRINLLTEELNKHLKRKSVFGILRLGNIIAVIAGFYLLWSKGKWYAIATAIVLIIVFIKLIHKDLANRDAIRQLGHLIEINKDELLALEGNYYHYGNGALFVPQDHFYANDMDIFGHASLFQFLNRTTSELGAEKLATWLSSPSCKEIIIDRQEATKELNTKNDWRQNLQSLGKESSIKKNTLIQITSWLKAPTKFIQFKHWRWLRWMLPAVIITVTGFYIFDFLSEQVWYLFLFIYLVIGYQLNKIIAPLHNQLSSLVDDLEVLSKSLSEIEKASFSSPLLQDLKNLLQENKNASVKIKNLKKILNKLDLRYNMVISIPLNVLLLWNLQQILDLEKWKESNNADIEKWFDVLAAFEVLNSLATIHFNNPTWCFPTINKEHFSISAKELGHPLINEKKRVNNFIHIHNSGEIMLVTGSNMAGKSTYLRSIGTNTVLTMAGAVVCAQTFDVSAVQLISSMRIADNLEESTSTFYAELKKLKTIIEKINNGEKIFILLDEILRGTNSLDRHTGSEALIRQFIKQKAAAILATHDVELAGLEKEFPDNILNYHFDAQINGEELFFDYKLKEGVCTNMNASLLMKKIGLEI